ncbi:MAG: MBL fold metallo-hydrolase [Phycisphaerales bacterium]
MFRALQAQLAVIVFSSLCAVAGPNPRPQGGSDSTDPFVVVLGIAQDGGFPQAGCTKDCCAEAWVDQSRRRHVTCLAVIDPVSSQRWIFEATPDFKDQIRLLDELAPFPGVPEVPGVGLAGIFLTHGHMGHYTGLMHLGHEAMGASNVPVYVMPRMGEFLSTNGPWDQLVRYKNIELHRMVADQPIQLNERISVTPFRVPHRDEYTEVVGYGIDGPNRSVLFIPDIDKWERWDRSIEELIAQVDVAYLDGTFFADGELPNRNMADILHPFIVESMQRFSSLPAIQRKKIRFIHLNHTNPALQAGSAAGEAITDAGFSVARELERVGL